MLIYYVTLGVGSSGKRFRFLIDTGSSGLWLLSKAVIGNGWRQNIKFDPKESKTFVPIDELFEEKYIEHSVRGYMASDSFKIGDSTVKSVRFGLVHEVSRFHESFKHYDGVLGMALQQFNPQFNHTLLEYMVSKGLISHRKFSLVLCGEMEDMAGMLGIGEDAEKHQPKPINYIRALDSAYWAASIICVTFLDKSFYAWNFVTILDTGMVECYLPDGLVLGIYKRLEEFGFEEGIRDYCYQKPMLPPITFDFGTFSLQFKSSEYILQKIKDDIPFCELAVKKASERFGNILILGMSFLRNFDTLFDAERGIIGFSSPTMSSS